MSRFFGGRPGFRGPKMGSPPAKFVAVSVARLSPKFVLFVGDGGDAEEELRQEKPARGGADEERMERGESRRAEGWGKSTSGE